MTERYDAAHISRFYDSYVEREWGRLAGNPRSRVNFHLHNYYLHQFVKAGDEVLEAGAGPGRFTLELAQIGARVAVGDISPVQLELHRQKMAEAGCESCVVARDVLDIVNLSQYADARFDAVVCYGGPLSYVFDRADEALAEMLRVTKPGGYVLLGVMSLAGSTQLFLEAVFDIARQSPETADRVIATSDLDNDLASPNGHYCRMYRWSQLQALLQRHPCEIVAVSASNYLSMREDEVLAGAAADPALWEAFLRWEVDLCREAGALDGGTHIISVVRKNTIA